MLDLLWKSKLLNSQTLALETPPRYWSSDLSRKSKPLNSQKLDLETFWALLGRSWDALGALLGALGALLGALGALLGALGTLLGLSWGALGSLLGASWAQLGNKPRGLHLLSSNLETKIQPSWLQNLSKIDYKKRSDFTNDF